MGRGCCCTRRCAGLSCASDSAPRLPLSFVIWSRPISQRAEAGISTSYTELLSQGGVSIGTSFLHPSVRSGPANPEAKLLMLDHAFHCGAVRVQFKVDTG